MSNSTLIAKIDSALACALQQETRLMELVSSIRENGRGLEQMPYPLISEMESLATELEVAAWAYEDGFQPEQAAILARVEIWLKNCLETWPNYSFKGKTTAMGAGKHLRLCFPAPIAAFSP